MLLKFPRYSWIGFQFLQITGLIFAGGTLSSRPAQAFPELIRHGYANCVTCHASPGGGGVLNAYGREISREALSTWGNEGETDLAWGSIKTPEWLSATVLARSLSFVRDTKTTVEGRTLLMQLDAEAAANSDHWGAAAAAGIQNPKGGTQSPFALRRAYLTYRPTDELSLRTGIFQHVYGLMPADHRIATRSGLGWDVGTETLNIEAAYIGEQATVFATALLGRPGNDALEQGASLSGSLFFAERFKVGLNAYTGKRPDETSSRHVFGTHAELGFTSHFYWLGELDLSEQAKTWGTYQYQKLGYEPIQGLHFYVAQDFTLRDHDDATSQVIAWGPGVQWFPRPHFEAQLYLQAQSYPSSLQDLNQSTVYAMLNFYL